MKRISVLVVAGLVLFGVTASGWSGPLRLALPDVVLVISISKQQGAYVWYDLKVVNIGKGPTTDWIHVRHNTYPLLGSTYPTKSPAPLGWVCDPPNKFRIRCRTPLILAPNTSSPVLKIMTTVDGSDTAQFNCADIFYFKPESDKQNNQSVCTGYHKRLIERLDGENARLKKENASLSPSGIAEQLARVKAANDKYQSVEQATAAGYAPASPCVSSPEGGMGIHYENKALVADGALDPLKPETLVYQPSGTGLTLVAVEYFKADTDADLKTDADRPTLFGRAFDGPMLGHNPPGTPSGTGMPTHFDLHVWLWKRNPSGLFAQWNPDVTCR